MGADGVCMVKSPRPRKAMGQSNICKMRTDRICMVEKGIFLKDCQLCKLSCILQVSQQPIRTAVRQMVAKSATASVTETMRKICKAAKYDDLCCCLHNSSRTMRSAMEPRAIVLLP